jgi:glucose dehydrogenase
MLLVSAGHLVAGADLRTAAVLIATALFLVGGGITVVARAAHMLYAPPLASLAFLTRSSLLSHAATTHALQV